MSGLARMVPAAVILAVVASNPATAQVQERSVYATVVDKSGTPVTALTPADFVVREDGVQREVLRVSTANDPLQIALLVDTSQAIERHVNDLRTALRAFVQQMAPKHEIAIIGFGERPTVLAEYTRDVPSLEKGIGKLFARRGTGAYMLDAIVEASRALRAREGARSVMIVITAEGPEFSERYHQTVLDQLGNTASLYSFVLTRRGSNPLDDAAQQRELTLAKGATATGGRREHLLTSMALRERLADLGAELNNQLRVDYARPGSLIPPERIDVSVTRADLTVRAPRIAPPKSRTD